MDYNLKEQTYTKKDTLKFIKLYRSYLKHKHIILLHKLYNYFILHFTQIKFKLNDKDSICNYSIHIIIDSNDCIVRIDLMLHIKHENELGTNYYLSKLYDIKLK